MSTFIKSGLVVVLVSALAGVAQAKATVTLVNINADGFGLNDPTPAAPIGGNPGTTLGEQRLFALQFVADEWASHLTSDAEIRIEVAFAPRPCNSTGAVLASTGVLEIFSDFPNAILPETWYHKALADALAGEDLDPTGDDLQSIYNSNLGATGCLDGEPFYLGVDNNHGDTEIDLVTTAMHEFGHGLGFSSFASSTTGAFFLGMSDVYAHNIFDLSADKAWEAMTDEERAASAVNTRKVVWTGKKVTKAVPQFLDRGTPTFAVLFPFRNASLNDVGLAQFGPALTFQGVTSFVADAVDQGGVSVHDGCEPIANRFQVLGRIAIVDRGTCAFTVKVKNMQNAGAVGVVIVDNAPGTPPAGMAGVDATITIPSVRISQEAGAALRAGLRPFTIATINKDFFQRQGASLGGQALLYTPNPVQPGSTISHWDVIAFPNLLMEPAINFDLQHMFDMTLPLLEDEGWKIKK